MPTDTISTFEFAFLLEGLRLGDPSRSTRFYQLVHPLLFRLTRKHGWGLSPDQLEEVVQETFLGLIRPNIVRFDPERGDVGQYLIGRVLNAAKTVRGQYGVRRSGPVFIELEKTEDRLLTTECLSISALSSKLVARRILTDVKPAMQEACYRVLADAEPKTVVALELGMNRFALAHRLRALQTVAMQFADCA